MQQKNPSADTEYSVKYILAINWIISMNAANLNRQESHMACHRVLQAQLGYSLGTTTFTKLQLKPIQSIIYKAYKPKIRLNRKFPTKVLQGPPEFNGLSTIPLITTQGFKQTQLLIVSLRNDDDTGKLASATLKFEQIDSGLTTPILKKTTTLTYQTWTTPTWVSSLKTFLHNMRAKIIISGQ